MQIRGQHVVKRDSCMLEYFAPQPNLACKSCPFQIHMAIARLDGCCHCPFFSTMQRCLAPNLGAFQGHCCIPYTFPGHLCSRAFPNCLSGLAPSGCCALVWWGWPEEAARALCHLLIFLSLPSSLAGHRGQKSTPVCGKGAQHCAPRSGAPLMGKYFPLCVLQVLFLLLLEVFHSPYISKTPGEINACCSFKTFSPFILLYEI